MTAQFTRNALFDELAHEIRTPLTSLTMSLHLLNRTVQKMENAEIEPQLDSISKNLIRSSVEDIDRLRKLIEEFFGFAQSELNESNHSKT